MLAVGPRLSARLGGTAEKSRLLAMPAVGERSSLKRRLEQRLPLVKLAARASTAQGYDRTALPAAPANTVEKSRLLAMPAVGERSSLTQRLEQRPQLVKLAARASTAQRGPPPAPPAALAGTQEQGHPVHTLPVRALVRIAVGERSSLTRRLERSQ